MTQKLAWIDRMTPLLELQKQARETTNCGPLSYLGTPYTLFPRGRHIAFREAARLAAALVESTGGTIYSPIVHCHPLSEFAGLDPLDVKLWLPFCEVMLSRCDTLIVAHMESWEISSGMRFEIERASAWRMPIFDLDVQTLTMLRRG